MLRRCWRRLWAEEHGSASPEWALLVTILLLGAVTGIVMSKPRVPAHQEVPPAARSR